MGSTGNQRQHWIETQWNLLANTHDHSRIWFCHLLQQCKLTWIHGSTGNSTRVAAYILSGDTFYLKNHNLNTNLICLSRGVIPKTKKFPRNSNHKNSFSFSQTFLGNSTQAICSTSANSYDQVVQFVGVSHVAWEWDFNLLPVQISTYTQSSITQHLHLEPWSLW